MSEKKNSFRIKAVLFDLVGTLIYVRDSVGTVYSNVASFYGIEADARGLDNAFQEVVHKDPQPSGGEKEEKKWWKKVVYETFDSAGYDLKEKFDEIFEVLFKEFTNENAWGIYPEVKNVLSEVVKNKYKTGLISNFDSRLELILRQLDLYKYFDCLSYSGKIGYSKPDPRIFQFALKELNILPEEALYVGDSLSSDYYPAQNLNINVYLIDRENKGLLQQSPAGDVKTIFSLNQICDILNLKRVV